jgi:hypothetical protein
MNYPQTSPAIRLFQVDCALRDIAVTLSLHRDAPLNDPYVTKLYREWNALLDERRQLTAAR